jgi:hypothetical protein
VKKLFQWWNPVLPLSLFYTAQVLYYWRSTSYHSLWKPCILNNVLSSIGIPILHCYVYIIITWRCTRSKEEYNCYTRISKHKTNWMHNHY